jgi:hypothetical protein
MKQKVFGYSFIFLVIFQLFSPWMMNFSKTGITLNTNIAQAASPATKRDRIASANTNAFLMITDIEDGRNISVSMFTSPNYRINQIYKIEFIREEDQDIDTNCPTGNLDLVVNPNLSSPSSANFAGLILPVTKNVGYLKSDYKFTIPKDFTAKCVEDNYGADAWGHYKFTYEIEDINGKKSVRVEETTSKESKESIADAISDHVAYIKAENGVGNGFNVEYGVINEKAYYSSYGSYRYNGKTYYNLGDLTITGKSTNKISADPLSDVDKPLKIKYLQDGKEHDLYNTYRTTIIDTKTQPPQNDGTYQLNVDWFKGEAFMLFDPKKVTGTKSSWPSLGTSTKQNIQSIFSNANYIMEKYSIDNFAPGLQDGKTVLDLDISMLINTQESRAFESWADIDKDGKASSKDLPGDDWDNFTADFGKPDVDTRPAKDGYGFYLLYSSTNKNPEIGGSDVYEVNLNEYIFGTKISSPIISEGKTGMVFGIEPIPVEPEKTYYFKLYANDHDTIFDDNGYTAMQSFTVPKDITQQARGAGVLQSGNDAGDTNDDWLPECDATDATTWLQGCLVVGFYYLIFVPTSALLAFAGYMLDKVLVYSISPDAYKAQYIVDGWRFIRDLCNLFFIFMLIYLAFKVILGIGKGTKQLIVNTLIIATVINFSYPLATIVIDISNITARQLYYNAFNQKDASSGEPLGLSATATSGYNPQRLIVDSMETKGLDKEKEKGSIFLILVIGVIFNIIAMFMFLRIAMQFIFRILGLVFAIILSPLAVFSYSLDETMRGKLKMVGFDQWLIGLLTDCFKAPVFLFLVLVMTLFINDNPFKSALVPGDVNNLEWWMSLIIPFALIMGFLMIIESATKNMSSGLSNMASEKFMATVGKAGSFAIGGAAGLVTGGVATLGRSTVGKWAAKSAENIRNSGKDNWINRQRLKALDKTAKASFDVRQTAVGSTITKQTGVNLDNSWVGKIPGMSTAETAGGYMAMKDRAKKKEIDRAELLGHDKKLEENLNHEKENKEAEVKDIEKDDEINRSLLKELSQQLKENTEALESQEKAITAKYDDDIRDQDDQVKISDGKIAQLTAKLASATTAEKAGIQNDINTETGNRSAAISEKTRLQKEKVEKIKDLKENSTVGQNVTKIKADIKTAKEKEAELSKKKNEAKFGVEIEIVKKDSHGHISYKKDSAGNVIINPTTGEPEPEMVKVRSGGIAGVDKAISRVKNNKMLEATLRHKRKSTGDVIELKSYLQKYTEDFNGDKDKAKAQLIEEFGKDNFEKISKTNYAGSAGKPGHMHEITHMINDHFHPEQHKSNYKPPSGGGGSKTTK